jgi:hypothetical protein
MASEKTTVVDSGARLDALKAKYGAVASATCPDGRVIVIKRPDFASYKRFTDKLTQDKASKASAFDELVMSCVVEPDRDQARSILADYPALVTSLAGAATELGGADIEITKSA